MNERKTLDPKWIVKEVEKHCNFLQQELVKGEISGKYYSTAELIRCNVDIAFSMGIAESCPLAKVSGDSFSDSYWLAYATQCTGVSRNAQGYLELDDSSSQWVGFVFGEFSYFDSSSSQTNFDKYTLTLRRARACFPPLPENCVEMPESIDGSSGARESVTFAVDRTNGVLAYVVYEHWGYNSRITNQWNWAHPDYDGEVLVAKAIKEHGKISLESAQAHEILYTQKSMGSDRIVAQMACEKASAIYYQLYGHDSNHPAVIEAVVNDFCAITRDSYVYYSRMLSSYKHMLAIKEAHPEVTEFPDIEELRELVAKYEPLEREEAWNRYLRD